MFYPQEAVGVKFYAKDLHAVLFESRSLSRKALRLAFRHLGHGLHLIWALCAQGAPAPWQGAIVELSLDLLEAFDTISVKPVHTISNTFYFYLSTTKVFFHPVSTFDPRISFSLPRCFGRCLLMRRTFQPWYRGEAAKSRSNRQHASKQNKYRYDPWQHLAAWYCKPALIHLGLVNKKDLGNLEHCHVQDLPRADAQLANSIFGLPPPTLYWNVAQDSMLGFACDAAS